MSVPAALESLQVMTVDAHTTLTELKRLSLAIRRNVTCRNRNPSRKIFAINSSFEELVIKRRNFVACIVEAREVLKKRVELWMEAPSMDEETLQQWMHGFQALAALGGGLATVDEHWNKVMANHLEIQDVNPETFAAKPQRRRATSSGSLSAAERARRV